MSAVVIPMKKADSNSRAFKPAGESWVWFTSMGLGIGLTMIVFLLGMIVYNGLEVFWPKPVVKIELKAGSAAGINGASLLAGEIIKSQTKRTAVINPEGEAQPEQREYQLFVGNKDLYGFSFKYLDRQEIATMDRPKDIIVAERLEYGSAIFIPKQLKLADGTMVPASAESFRSALNEVIEQGGERRRTIRRIEREEIGELNREIEDIRLRRRALESKSSRPADFETIVAEYDARGASLQTRYEVLAEKAKELRAQQRAAELSYVTVDGATTTIPAGDVLGYYYPNQLTFLSKLGQFTHRFWTFLSDEPREANTEGGIFPAIFGTFVMTLLMSVVVTPFGVLAAIYLREYAKQGFLVRCVRIAVNNLAGVPSIVFGVFGLGFFVYVVGGSIDQLFYSLSLPTPTFGTGGVLWASLTLALMTVPVVIVATEEALAAVSRGTREGSLACGASKWQTIQRIVLPASLPGILTGLILAMARGAGEVAPLMLVGVVKLAPTLPLDTIYPFVHLERKFMHLGFHIYDLGFQSPDSEAAKPMVFATTFLLILLVVMLNLGAIVIRNRLRKKYRVSTF
jgi:phosphate transport system permease protein